MRRERLQWKVRMSFESSRFSCGKGSSDQSSEERASVEAGMMKEGSSDQSSVERASVEAGMKKRGSSARDGQMGCLGFVPLCNGGNDCFCNAVVQAVMRVPCLREAFASGQLEREASETRLQAVQCVKRLVALAGAGGRQSLASTAEVRKAVATHSVSSGGINFADGQQHCALEFFKRLVELCGENMEELLRFERTAEVKCQVEGCPGMEFRDLPPATEVTLSVPLGFARISWDELMEKEMSIDRDQRCGVCCPDQYRPRARPEDPLVVNEGVRHRGKTGHVVPAAQRGLVVRVSPFSKKVDPETGLVRTLRSRRRLVGLEPDRVMFGGVQFRVMAAVCHLGETPNSGHYIAYVRLATGGWLRCDDTQSSVVEELPLGQLYFLLLERVMVMPQAESQGETSAEASKRAASSGKGRGRPPKRGRRSEESKAKSALVTEGAADRGLGAHNAMRDKPAEARKALDKQKSSDVWSWIARPGGGRGVAAGRVR